MEISEENYISPENLSDVFEFGETYKKLRDTVLELNKDAYTLATSKVYTDSLGDIVIEAIDKIALIKSFIRYADLDVFKRINHTKESIINSHLGAQSAKALKELFLKLEKSNNEANFANNINYFLNSRDLATEEWVPVGGKPKEKNYIFLMKDGKIDEKLVSKILDDNGNLNTDKMYLNDEEFGELNNTFKIIFNILGIKHKANLENINSVARFCHEGLMYSKIPSSDFKDTTFDLTRKSFEIETKGIEELSGEEKLNRITKLHFYFLSIVSNISSRILAILKDTIIIRIKESGFFVKNKNTYKPMVRFLNNTDNIFGLIDENTMNTIISYDEEEDDE